MNKADIKLVCDLCGCIDTIDFKYSINEGFIINLRKEYSLVLNSYASSKSLYLCEHCYSKLENAINECKKGENKCLKK